MTTEAPTNKGVLTDKEGAGFPGCRILLDKEAYMARDTPFTVMSHVQKYLDALKKQTRVCFTTENGKISKIWEDKEPAKDEVMSDAEVAALKARADAAAKEKAHNAEMERISKEAAQAKDKPLESGIKIVQGQITAIDQGLHTVEVKDKEGKHHQMMWAAPLNEKMAKLKQWFFVSISAEKSGEYWKVIDQTYFKKPDDWPVSQKGYGGGKSYTPRNERIIVLQSCAKLAAEVFAITTTPESMDFDAAMDLIITRAIKDTDTLMKAGGA